MYKISEILNIKYQVFSLINDIDLLFMFVKVQIY